MRQSISRREFLKTSTASSLALGALGCRVAASKPKAWGMVGAEHPQADKYNIYFGDLHNHNEVGYAWSSPIWIEARA